MAGVLRFTMVKKLVRLRRLFQHSVHIKVRSLQEQTDVSTVNKNHPAVNNVRDNVDAGPPDIMPR